MSKIIKFEKENCPNCVMVDNYLSDKGVEVVYINIMDADPELCVKYEIHSVPVTILLDDNGEEVERSIGFNPPQLESLINKLK